MGIIIIIPKREYLLIQEFLIIYLSSYSIRAPIFNPKAVSSLAWRDNSWLVKSSVAVFCIFGRQIQRLTYNTQNRGTHNNTHYMCSGAQTTNNKQQITTTTTTKQVDWLERFQETGSDDDPHSIRQSCAGPKRKNISSSNEQSGQVWQVRRVRRVWQVAKGSKQAKQGSGTPLVYQRNATGKFYIYINTHLYTVMCIHMYSFLLDSVSRFAAITRTEARAFGPQLSKISDRRRHSSNSFILLRSWVSAQRSTIGY